MTIDEAIAGCREFIAFHDEMNKRFNITLRGAMPHMEAVLAELARLRSALPKTKDRVTVMFGDMVFPPCGHGPLEVRFRGGKVYCCTERCWDYVSQNGNGSGTYHDVGECFSTREAAEAKGK